MNGCCSAVPAVRLHAGAAQKTSSVCLRHMRNLRQSYALPTRWCWLAGGHGWMVDIDQLVDRLGIHTDVVALGAVSGAELGYLYSKARLLLMPSMYEGFGLPILEAFQFGVPVVTANCSSMPEVAGAAGRLVDPLQVESIRAGIERRADSRAARSLRLEEGGAEHTRGAQSGIALKYLRGILVLSSRARAVSGRPS